MYVNQEGDEFPARFDALLELLLVPCGDRHSLLLLHSELGYHHHHRPLMSIAKEASSFARPQSVTVTGASMRLAGNDQRDCSILTNESSSRGKLVATFWYSTRRRGQKVHFQSGYPLFRVTQRNFRNNILPTNGIGHELN